MGPTSYSRWYQATCQNKSSVVIDLSRIEAVHLETRSVEMFSGRCRYLSDSSFSGLHAVLTGREPKTMESEGD